MISLPPAHNTVKFISVPIFLLVLLSGFNTSSWSASPVKITGTLNPLINVDAHLRQDISPAYSKDMERAAQQIYRQALKLFSEGSYWSCARELIILLDFYSQFSRIDGVEYYLAECLYEMELNTACIRMYKHLIKRYPESEYISAALFGLEKVNYRLGNYKNSLTLYYAILKRSDRQSIEDGARYYAGQSYYYLKNYDMASSIFDDIDSRSEYYDAGLYTMGLALLKKKRIREAITCFRKLVGLPIISGERRRIVDEGRLTLGFIYFELGYFEEAISYFEDISDTHENYQDALLAMGWAALKLEDYQRVLKPLLKLVKKFPYSANAEEAYFLLGQSYVELKQYDNAIKAYQKIVDLYPRATNLQSNLIKVTAALTQEEEKIEQMKIKLLVQESKLLDALPLDGYGDIPNYLKREKKKLEEFRENLLKKILQERDVLTEMMERIEYLKKLAARKERRKDWRGYAEYGIARALFLKGMFK